MHFAQAALLFTSFIASPLVPRTLSVRAASIAHRATTCNGHPELCTKTFGNVTFVGAHDSYAVDTGNLASNQDYNATTQLSDGIRMLQVQAHNSAGTIHLCHTSCSLLDSGTLTDYLSSVKTWLDANPNEVIAILIVNIDNLAPSVFDSAYKAAGLDTLSFAPASASLASDAWPTLGSLIDSGKRVVSFLDNAADFSAVPYLIDEFTNVWETAYDVTDQTFDCAVNRTGTADNKMYLINHFLDKYQTLLGTTFPIPNKDLLNVTNSASGTGSLGLQASQCAAQYAKNPTFMLVDFYNWGTPSGSVFQVAATLNGVTYTASSVATPIVSGSSSQASSGIVSTGKSKSGAVPLIGTTWVGAVLGMGVSVAFGVSVVLG